MPTKTKTINPHTIADLLAEGLKAEDTDTWTWHQGPTLTAVKRHIKEDDHCVAYLEIEGRTFSMLIQELPS